MKQGQEQQQLKTPEQGKRRDQGRNAGRGEVWCTFVIRLEKLITEAVQAKATALRIQVGAVEGVNHDADAAMDEEPAVLFFGEAIAGFVEKLNTVLFNCRGNFVAEAQRVKARVD